MRHLWASGAAAVSILAATAAGAAVAQAPATPAPAAARPAAIAPGISADERARLVAAGQRGILLFELARAAQLTTRDMLSRLPDPTAAGVVGWVATQEGPNMTVVYYANGADGPVAVYRGAIAGTGVTGEVFTGAARPALNPVQRRIAAARAAVANLDSQPCAGDFNVFVIPPATADAPIDVYKLTPQTQRGRYPLGGHFLATVAPDGTIASTRAFTTSCTYLDVPADAAPGAGAPAAGAAQVRPLTVTSRADPLPTEIHVFLSLWMNRPLLVSTGSPDRSWGVARGRIGLVGGPRTPPPGPGR